MKRFILPLIILFIFSYCGSELDKVEIVIENGVEVVINHIEPYKLKGKPTSLYLKEEFVIDPEKDELSDLDLGEFVKIDVDPMGNIYFWARSSNTNHIFKFDRKGNFLTSFGRKGQGPGEIQFITSLTINSHNNIEIADVFRRKLITLASDGTLIKEKDIEFSMSFIRPLINGRYIVFYQEYNPEVKYNYDILQLRNSNLEQIKELYRIEYIKYSMAEKIEGVSRGSVWGVSDKNIYYGSSQRGYEISVFDFDGNLVRKIRKEYKSIPPTEEYKEKFLERFKRTPERMNKVYFPKYMPPFQFGFVDDDGWLFVMTYERGENPGEYLYDVFNPDGVFVMRTVLDNYGQSGNVDVPLFAMAKGGWLYCVREKESGFKELVVYKMEWE